MKRTTVDGRWITRRRTEDNAGGRNNQKEDNVSTNRTTGNDKDNGRRTTRRTTENDDGGHNNQKEDNISGRRAGQRAMTRTADDGQRGGRQRMMTEDTTIKKRTTYQEDGL